MQYSFLLKVRSGRQPKHVCQSPLYVPLEIISEPAFCTLTDQDRKFLLTGLAVEYRVETLQK